MESEEGADNLIAERSRPVLRWVLRAVFALLGLTTLNQVRVGAQMAVVALTAFMVLVSLLRAAFAVSMASRSRHTAIDPNVDACKKLAAGAVAAAVCAAIGVSNAIEAFRTETTRGVIIGIVTTLWMLSEAVVVHEQSRLASPSLIEVYGFTPVVHRLANSLPEKMKRPWAPLETADRVAAPILWTAVGAVFLTIVASAIPADVRLAQLHTLWEREKPKPPSAAEHVPTATPTGPAPSAVAVTSAPASPTAKADDICGYPVEPKLKSLVHPDVRQTAWEAYSALGPKAIGCPDGVVLRQNGIEIVVLAGRTSRGGYLVVNAATKTARAIYPSLADEVAPYMNEGRLVGVGDRIDTGVTVHQWFRLSDGSCRLGLLGYGQHGQVLLDGPTTYVVVTAALRVQAMPFVVPAEHEGPVQEYEVTFAYSRRKTTVRVSGPPTPHAEDSEFGIDTGPNLMCPDLDGLDALSVRVKQRNERDRATRSLGGKKN